MPTRLKRPPFWRHLALTFALVGFMGYLGANAMTGRFGIESREDLLADIDALNARSGALQAQIDAYKHRIALFDARKLDPDILEERARALLNMAHEDDLVVMVDPVTGQPKSRSFSDLSQNQLNSILVDYSGH